MCILHQYRLGSQYTTCKPCSGTYSASSGCTANMHTVFLGGNRRSSVVSCVVYNRYTSVPSSLFGSLIQRGVSRSPLRLRKEGLPRNGRLLCGSRRLKYTPSWTLMSSGLGVLHGGERETLHRAEVKLREYVALVYPIIVSDVKWVYKSTVE